MWVVGALEAAGGEAGGVEGLAGLDEGREHRQAHNHRQRRRPLPHTARAMRGGEGNAGREWQMLDGGLNR